MARLKLKQVLSNLDYNQATSQLILSGSGAGADFLISGSVYIATTPQKTGSLTIQNIDSFGDSGSFDTMDLGEY